MSNQTIAERRALSRLADRTANEAAEAYRSAPKGERLAAIALVRKARALALKFGRAAR